MSDSTSRSFYFIDPREFGKPSPDRFDFDWYDEAIESVRSWDKVDRETARGIIGILSQMRCHAKTILN